MINWRTAYIGCDDFYAMSIHDLWKEYKRISQLWDQFEKTMEAENESRI